MSAADRGAKPLARLVAFWLIAALALAAQPAAARQKAPPPAPAPAADATVIQPDPQVRRGVTSNGLRYAVMSNPSDDTFSMRLGFDVGSFDEEAGERGVAHLVEHLAFDASEGSELAVDKVFNARGIAFGRDQNASTSVNQTIYRLDLPSSDRDTIRLGLKWLRGVADGLSVTEAAVAKERAVILAEKSNRLTPGAATAEAVMAFQGRDVRSARQTIGAAGEISAFSASTALAFYRRLYRPENAVMVVVGDLPLDDLEQLVVETFQTWWPAAPAPPRAVSGPVDFKRPLSVFVRADPSIPSGLAACRVREPAVKIRGKVANWRGRIASGAWILAINRRLAGLASSQSPPFLYAAVIEGDGWREAATVCIVAVPLGDKWSEAAEALQVELRKMAASGPSEAEAAASIEEIRSRYRGAMHRASARSSEDLAAQIIATELDREVFASPAEDYRAFNAATEDMAAADLKSAFARDWSGAGPLLAAVGPAPPSAAEIESVWARAGMAGPVDPEPVAEAAAPKWAYDKFGRPGRVARTEKVAIGDFTRFTFRNGVILNVKEMGAGSRGVEVRVRFGAGRRELANEDFVAANLAAGLFKEGGLGRLPYTQLDGLFRDGSWDATMNVADGAFVLNGQTTTSGLPAQLEILAAYVTDPGFDPNIDARIPTSVDAMYRIFRGVPSLVMSQAVGEALHPGGPSNLPPKSVLSNLRSEDFRRLLGGALAQAPLEITIVGDIDTRYALRETARTFGALPPRKAAKRERGDTAYLRFPAKAPPTIRATHEGAPEKAIVGSLWPMYVATPERRREEVAAMLVSRLLGDRLQDRVRRQLSLAYAPMATTVSPDDADQGYIAAVVETTPGAVETVMAEVRSESLALARGEFDQEALDRARKPFVSGLEAALESKGFWAELISGSSRDPARVADNLKVVAIASEITLNEAVISARTWLSAEPVTVVATPQPAPASAAPAAPR